VFLSYTTNDGGILTSRISSFLTLNGGATLDASSERVLIALNQPTVFHKGGNIAFGMDGYLYVGFGDGGNSGQNNSQVLTTMLGKMVRIDVGTADTASTYTIPPTNPSSTNPKCGRATNAQACPEMFAYGLRNPWRWSFDRSTGELWAGDVGAGSWEEIDLIVRGGNYGWWCREGAHDFMTSGCPTSGFVDPVAEYPHSLGVAVTGGYVYRGPQATSYQGRYIFGDFFSGRIWALAPQPGGGFTQSELADTGLNIVAFAQANDGDLYVVDYDGALYRLAFQPGSGGSPIPTSLRATGCVEANNPSLPASGMVPYTINAPFWSDGAVKQRWLALPDTATIAVTPSGDWNFPAGTVLMKTFRLGASRVETRLFMHHTDGTWAGYSYQWNDAQTDATLVPGGATKQWGTQSWDYPSEVACLQCHTAAAGRSLGLETAQLNRSFTYPQTNRTANQITTLDGIGLLTPRITTPPSALPALRDPTGVSGSVTERARAYLHTNCAQCHRPGGPTPVGIDFRETTTLALTNACDRAPQAGDLGLGPTARIIDPGSPANSVLVERMRRRDHIAQMPPVGSSLVDTAGVALLEQWITSLSSCN
jgi:uncharacterized repeat protein (TIGR03806 family)